MLLEVLTPGKKVFEGEVESIILPGLDGTFEILNNHAPLIAALKEGDLKIKTGKEREAISIGSGFVEVNRNKVVVLAENSN